MRFLSSEAAEAFYNEVEKRLSILLSTQAYTYIKSVGEEDEELKHQILQSEKERLRHKIIAELNSENTLATYGKARYSPQTGKYEKQE